MTQVNHQEKLRQGGERPSADKKEPQVGSAPGNAPSPSAPDAVALQNMTKRKMMDMDTDHEDYCGKMSQVAEERPGQDQRRDGRGSWTLYQTLTPGTTTRLLYPRCDH